MSGSQSLPARLCETASLGDARPRPSFRVLHQQWGWMAYYPLSSLKPVSCALRAPVMALLVSFWCISGLTKGCCVWELAGDVRKAGLTSEGSFFSVLC